MRRRLQRILFRLYMRRLALFRHSGVRRNDDSAIKNESNDPNEPNDLNIV